MKLRRAMSKRYQAHDPRRLPRVSVLGQAWVLVALALTVPSAGAKTLTGMLTYDKVLATLANGLNYNNITKRPIRNAVVRLLDANGARIQQTVSNSNGRYFFTFNDNITRVRIRVLAMTNKPRVRVEDNTRNNALYSMQSVRINTPARMTTRNLNAPSGWGGTEYTSARIAAPFAILDAMDRAARSFMAVRPGAAFPPLKVNWSIDNRPEDGDLTNGQIGTSHYDGELYILGKADVDTDEYDSHVMVHEWGHFFEDKLGRSDSPGGSHDTGDILDPRLAFGEGWGNALSAMIFHPDANYKDTGGIRQETTTIVLRMEQNLSDDPTPGWFSEASVQSILYDLFDPAGLLPIDRVEFGLGNIFDVMTGKQKTTRALTTIFSFVDALKRKFPGQSSAIDTLLRHHSISPVRNNIGTGERNNGGSSANLPVYRTMTVGGPDLEITFLADVNNVNRLGANRYIRFNTSNGDNVTITATSNFDVGLKLYRTGSLAASADKTFSGAESINFDAVQNETYVLVVQGFVTNEAPGTTYTANINIQ